MEYVINFVLVSRSFASEEWNKKTAKTTMNMDLTPLIRPYFVKIARRTDCWEIRGKMCSLRSYAPCSAGHPDVRLVGVTAFRNLQK